MENFDQEGFLLELSAWSEPLAQQIAAAENISLTPAHWQIIYLLRKFYQNFERSPNMRALINFLKQELNADEAKQKANSIYLLSLFPQSPAKLASKIAGLPKPENCL